MTLPRVGFLGTGWIGRSRLAAIRETGAVAIAAIVEPDADSRDQALALAPEAEVLGSVQAMFDAGLGGLVIATPSALHADQAIAALARGMAVFCQKPLGRTYPETEAVIAAAHTADRLLGVDFSYRRTAAAQALKAQVDGGALGRVFAADLTFHNAYGPDKAWFHDRALAGGGCVMDLGVHLIDLLLWLLDDAKVGGVAARLFAGGDPLPPASDRIEDYATIALDLDGGIAARLACSWNLDAGCDAVIAVTLYGTRGAASLRNVGGGFYDFEALRLDGTTATLLAAPPDAWSGRVAADWARRLAVDPRYDPAIASCAVVAGVIDRIYAGASGSGGNG